MDLSWDSSDEAKKRAVNGLLLIDDKDMHLLLQPSGKGVWDGAAEVITMIGYPRVKVILSGLLEWLQDMNWPGAQQIAEFLRSIGSPVVPHIREILKQHPDDEIWIYWLFELFIDDWEKGNVVQIQDELIDISKGRLNDLSAIRILFKHKIIEMDEVISQLTEKYNNALKELKELENKYIGVDCIELERGFKEVIFKPNLSRKYYEENKSSFSYCSIKSNLEEYLRDVEELIKEVSNFA